MSLRYRSDADFDTAVITLDDGQQERQRRLLDGVVVSLHDHPVLLPQPLTQENWALHAQTHEDMLAVRELDRSPLNVVFASSLSEPDLDHILHWARAVDSSVETGAADTVRHRTVVRGLEDLVSLGSGLGVVKALEDVFAIGDNLDQLVELFEVGIRSAGISYNFGSALGGGLAEQEDRGLTVAGRQAVALMNELGMAIDISHAGDRTGIQAAEGSSRPVLITHAGARAVWSTDRMKPDEVIRAVADTGGLIGVEAAPGSTRARRDSSKHDIDDFIAHLEYCAELVGVDHVALGPDTFYGDHVRLYEAAGWSARPVKDVPALDIDAVRGADNPSEVPRQVAASLIKRGWSDPDIAKVLGENAIRVMKEILQPCPAKN